MRPRPLARVFRIAERFGARSPSGKAEVCKTSIGGSIPPRASNNPPLALGLWLLAYDFRPHHITSPIRPVTDIFRSLSSRGGREPDEGSAFRSPFETIRANCDR